MSIETTMPTMSPTGVTTTSSPDHIKNFYTVLTVSMFIASLVGTTLLFLLMTSVKYRSRSYSVYFMFLAISDLVAIMLVSLVDIDDWLVRSHGRDDFFFKHLESCMLIEHTITISTICSSWILIALVIDRFIVVVFPRKRASFCTQTRAIIVCITISLVATTLTLTAVFANITEIVALYKSGVRSCLVEETNIVHAQGYFIFLNVFLGGVIPALIAVALAAKIITKLRNRDIVPCVNTTTENLEPEQMKQSAFAVAVIGFVFAATTTPVFLAEIAEIAMKKTQEDFDGFVGAADRMWGLLFNVRLINYFCKFYILMVTGRMYRHDLGRLFGFGPYMEKLHDDTDPILD